ncbi:ion transporter [Enterococcus hulanensis]|uniref:ion channel n=1 Tax=Enterococcus hulanensis TaxID=2559929 RepID=UPI001A8C645F|nr:ion channel [Enterococcus hulanensis]MBO0458395.1 ion transporter [Enterococcus hulanensis]
MIYLNLQKKKFYDLTIIILAIVSIVFVVLDFASLINISEKPFRTLDSLILIVFAYDYLSRLLKSENKKDFFARNLFDLIAIIPFNSIFSFFRLARVFKIARVTRLFKFSRLVGVTGKLTNRIDGFLKTNGFRNALYVSLVLILISATMYSIAENVAFVDSIWWAVVTTTTVGYGDISPHTPMGRIAAILLMFLGIGFIGILTSTITEYFNSEKDTKENEIASLHKKIDLLMEKIQSLEDEIKRH